MVLAGSWLGSEQRERQGPEGQRAGEESANKDRASSHMPGDHWEKQLAAFKYQKGLAGGRGIGFSCMASKDRTGLGAALAGARL